MSKRPSVMAASFQRKLFSIFTILSLFTSCVFISVYIFDKVSETRRQAGNEVLLRARQLADSVRLPLYAEDPELVGELAAKAGGVPEISRVVVKAADGRVLADFRPQKAVPSGETIGATVEVSTLPAALPGVADGENHRGHPIGTVRIERGTDDLRQDLYRHVGVSCFLALLFWLAVSGLSYLVLRRTTRSFEALVRGVQAMKDGDYASRIPVVCADEPGRVALAINALAETLQRRDEENRSLTRELRSSIETEVRAREEVAAANRSLAKENVERVQAERTARKSEETLRALMDIMPVGVLLTRQDGTVEYVNHFMVECFGYGREEIPTLDAWFTLAFPDPGYRGAKMESQREALATGREPASLDPKPYDARVTCKAGNVRHVLVSNQVQGERALVVMIDLTEREMMQEQLNKVQKLESLGVLAGGIAHNFNNALTSVLGFISLTRCRLPVSDEARHYLQLAEKASLRAAEMARQLLTFASGGAPVKRSVSLRKLVDEVVALTFNASNVRCNVEMPASLPPIRADEGQMVQAFSNIVINAMQAMPGGGIITIRAEADTACCLDPGHLDQVSYVSLSVTDQGHGIAESDLPRIFDPYFSTKETTGLGLASVHSIIYRHGGHVSVASEVGKGATFTICLPSTKEPPLFAGEAAAPSARRPADASVLVMDDDAAIRELSGEMLGFLGYRAVTCADGGEAVTLYRANRQAGTPFLAAILDLSVPGGIGGVEAAREILADDPHANLLVCSGYSVDPVMAEYRKYGFCGAVAKPYRAEELNQELGLLHRP